ncbi:hypothetical protein AWB74_08235 [Caballeronia arvi]|uniref:Uncharacterized protein n=1 Tax=Caballeronia arvi TaxID=1777135 RepID=A0A158L4C0_9BURK|nr:hypothetical protein AWB74_08235 [Caballeronia arvi]
MWQTMHIGLGSIMSPAGRFGGSEDPDASVETFRTIKGRCLDRRGGVERAISGQLPKKMLQ